MERSTTEEIANFWSHSPKGMTYREICRMSREERIERAARPAAIIAVAAEAEVQISLIKHDEALSFESEVTAA